MHNRHGNTSVGYLESLSTFSKTSPVLYNMPKAPHTAKLIHTIIYKNTPAPVCI